MGKNNTGLMLRRFVFITFLWLFSVTVIAQANDWDKIASEGVKAYREGDFTKALVMADSGMALAGQRYGFSSNQYRSSASNKAYVLTASDRLEEAIVIWKDLLSVSSGTKKPTVFQIEDCLGLAKVFVSMAQYDSAEYYLELGRYLFITIPRENPAHSDTSSLELSNAFIQLNSTQASLYYSLGFTEKAVQYLQDQIDYYLDVYPEVYEDLPNYRLTLSNLSVYYLKLNELDEAHHYTREFLRITPKTELYDRLYAYQNLGSVYRKMDLLDSAIITWESSLIEMEESDLRGTYLHNIILNNLGELYLDIEEYSLAEALLTNSYNNQISKGTLNPPLFKTTLLNLSETYRWSGRYEIADSLYKRLIANIREDMRYNYSHLSENERISYLRTQMDYIDSYQSFALEISNLLPLQDTEEPYFNPNIAGDLLNLQLAMKGLILDSGKKMRTRILESGDEDVIRIFRLWEIRKTRLGQLLTDDFSDSVEVANLKQKVEENEKWLASKSNEFKSAFVKKQVHWKEVQSHLGRDEALVELVRLVDGLVYGALILTRETSDQPILTLVMSTRSKHLEKEFYNYYQNAINYQLEDTLSHNTYWKPIKNALTRDGKKLPATIYLSNAGVYNQINLETIFDPTLRKYNIELTNFIVLSSSRDLLEESHVVSESTGVLVGNPEFSAETRANLGALPGTQEEISQIENLLSNRNWKLSTFTGQDANKKNLRSALNPSLLHIATHGYFESEAVASTDAVQAMLGSGLILSSNEEYDAVLTANEVTTLSLDSTNLVVLSACETGKGQINFGDGVYGLQRGFHAAGARHVVMSLWKVDDTATQKLMTGFYRNWQNGTKMNEAFRASKLNLMKEYGEPYYWGAFVWTGK